MVSDRHFGIGSDGLILIKPSRVADCQMDMYNLDGSRGAMCGNGIRCVAKYVYDYGLTDKTRIHVATKSGIKVLDLTVKDGKVQEVCVDMGAPILKPDEIPVDVQAAEAAGEERLVNWPIQVNGAPYHMTCVSMGNPHCIVPVEDPGRLVIEEIGPKFENHPAFPDRVNTEFIRVLDRKTVEMRVWERGSGETLACGTGTCATVVAGVLNGLCDRKAVVHLLGGDLEIEWNEDDNCVYMTGSATEVFEGEITLPEEMTE